MQKKKQSTNKESIDWGKKFISFIVLWLVPFGLLWEPGGEMYWIEALFFSLVITIVLLLLSQLINCILKKSGKEFHPTISILILLIIFGTTYSIWKMRTLGNTIVEKDNEIGELSEKITETPTPTNVVNGIAEDELFPYEKIEEVPACDFEDIKHHCIHYVVGDESDNDVAKKAYSEERFQGKIKEFYRDEKGSIPLWSVGRNNFTLVPPLKMDLDLYTKYFALLNISKCDENANEKPCWYESEGEEYVTLANWAYGKANYIDCIKRANKIEYDSETNGLKPMEIKVGNIIVLPICD